MDTIKIKVKRYKEIRRMIEINEVSKVYKMGKEKVVALNNVSLKINKGD